MNEDKKTKLKIITLGGTESVTKNMTVYEYEDDIIIVDCGIGFPDDETYGVDVVIPDFTYLLENSHKVRALIITHAHEDHIGAVPFFLTQLNVPIYCASLVEGFLKNKLNEKKFKNLQKNVSFHIIDDHTKNIRIGAFGLSAFGLNHSVPRSLGFAIETPVGTIIHMADYRIDLTPVLDKPIDIGTISEYGDRGVLCLLSDCLGSTSEGYSKSESTLGETFFSLFSESAGRQIFVTTISSNISRMYQITQAAIKLNRKIVLVGRSIDQSARVGRSLGLLPFSEDAFVDERESAKYPQSELVYIIAGCYGQEGSALDRLARNEHDSLILEENALVIFSADPNPPGVDVAVEKMMSNLTLAGAEVVYSKIQDNLHVSGHGTKGDLMTIASVVKPKFFIPLGGTITKMRAYTNMLTTLGFQKNQVFEMLEGQILELGSEYAKITGRIETKQVYIDSVNAQEVNPIVIRDRNQLSSEGVFVVVLPVNASDDLVLDKLELISRGFVYVKGSSELMDKSRKFIQKSVSKSLDRGKDWINMRRKLEADLQRFLHQETGRRPLVIVHSIKL